MWNSLYDEKYPPCAVHMIPVERPPQKEPMQAMGILSRTNIYYRALLKRGGGKSWK